MPDLEKITKLTIPFGVLLAGVGVFYYFVIFTPHQQQAALDLQKQDAQALLQQAQQTVLLQGCFLLAQESFRTKIVSFWTGRRTPDYSISYSDVSPILHALNDDKAVCLKKYQAELNAP